MWSNSGDRVVELCDVDVSAKLVEDWLSLWVGDLGEWGLGCLLSLWVTVVVVLTVGVWWFGRGGWVANSCHLPPSSVALW
jgi:hypothetical protein